MSTNSQKTEDMLDQTFANFDSEVTGADNDDDNDDGGAPTSEPTKKKSSNMMVFIGAGIAAVGAIAYIFVFKPMMEPPPVKRQAIVAKAPEVAPPPAAPVAQEPAAPAAPVAQEPVVPAAPVVPEPVSPVAPPTAPVVPEPVSPVAPPTAPVVAEATAPVAPPTAPVVAEPVAPVVTPTAPIVAEAAAPVAPPTAPVAANMNNNSASMPSPQMDKAIATVDELKSMFEQQTTEFRTVLTNIDDRVVRIESLLQQQKDINVKFDERLVALETGRKVMPQVSEDQSSVKSVVKKAAKKRSVKSNDYNKSANKTLNKSPNKYSENESSEAGVVLDKSSVEQKEKVAVNNLPRLSLHSIYGGRIWIKNEDGSLSTYIAGDKLPTGEVIKKVDDENFEVATNKRVIKY